MLITLSTIESGQYVQVKVIESDKRENTRRLSRSATLDGGCVITDGGYSDSDRTLSYKSNNVSKDTADALWSFFEAESLIGLSCNEGYFLGYLESISIDEGSIDISFLVKEKLT